MISSNPRARTSWTTRLVKRCRRVETAGEDRDAALAFRDGLGHGCLALAAGYITGVANILPGASRTLPPQALRRSTIRKPASTLAEIMLRTASFVALLLAVPASAADPDAKQIEFFEKKIRPALVEHCFKCHSADAEEEKKLRGGLRLDTKEGLIKGGDTGAAVVPGKPKDGTLLRAALHRPDLQMPPKGKLPDG